MPSQGTDLKRMFDQTYVWRTSASTLGEFRRLVTELGRAEEREEGKQHLIDQIKALPGFPAYANPERDLIQIDVEKKIIIH